MSDGIDWNLPYVDTNALDDKRRTKMFDKTTKILQKHSKQTKTKIPAEVTTVRNAVTGRAKELLESGVSADLEKKLDKAIKDAKHTTDALEEARKVPDEILHKRFDI